MPKSISSAMNTFLATGETDLSAIWRITRTDGETFFFTDHDQDIVFNGDTYKATSGFERTAVVNTSDLAVDNLDLVGVLSDSDVSETDVRAGKFDGATIEISFVSQGDPDTRGEIKLRRGTVGETRVTPQGYFLAELRGLAQPLQQNTLALYSPHCRADLGDSTCKFPIKPDVIQRETDYEVGDFVRVATDPYGEGFEVYEERIYECTTAGTTAATQPTFDTTIDNTTTDGTAVFTARDSFMRVATIVTVTNQRTFVVSADLDAYADGWFDQGVLTWETGNNDGVSYEIKSWTLGTRTLVLWEDARLEVQPGDQFRLYPGCHLRVEEDCRDKFKIAGSTNFADGNVKNFRGEPFVPGSGLAAIVPNGSGAR